MQYVSEKLREATGHHRHNTVQFSPRKTLTKRESVVLKALHVAVEYGGGCAGCQSCLRGSLRNASGWPLTRQLLVSTMLSSREKSEVD